MISRFCSRQEGRGFEVTVFGRSLVFWTRSITGNGYRELWLFGHQVPIREERS